jgi:hypothetical protein
MSGSLCVQSKNAGGFFFLLLFIRAFFFNYRLCFARVFEFDLVEQLA